MYLTSNIGHGLLGWPDQLVALVTGKDPLVVAIGDSRVYGQANAQNFGSALEWKVNTANGSITFASQQASNTTDPPPFLPGGTPSSEIGPTSLVAYAVNTSPGFGPEMTLMTELFRINPKFNYLVKCGITASLLETHWLPASTYMLASTGKNLFNTQCDRIAAYETLTGRQTAIIFVDLSTNDASLSGPSGRFAANMNTMVLALHAKFPNAVIVWPLMFVGTGQTFASTVYSQMLTYAATAPAYFMMPNFDHLTLKAGDPFHEDTNSVLTMGSIVAWAGSDLRGIARPTYGPAPAVAGIGVTLYGNSASLSPLAWPGTQDSHTELLIAIASGVTPSGNPALQTVSAPAGWTPVTNGQITAVGFTSTWRIFSRPVGAGEVETDTVPPSKNRRAVPVTVNFTGSTDNLAKRITIAGPNPHSTVNTQLSVQPNVFNTGPNAIPALSPSADNALVLYFVGGGLASAPATSTLTAAGVTGLTKLAEAAFNMPSADQVLLAIYAGTLATHGPGTGTASFTTTVNTLAIASAVVMVP